MVQRAEAIARQVVGALHILLTRRAGSVEKMGIEAVEPERSNKLEILRDLHLVDHVGRVTGRQGLVSRDEGEACRRHATNLRIRQAGIAGELGGSPGRYA